MTRPERVVVDTNVLISRLLLPGSVPARAVSQVVRHGQMLMSEATLEELAQVLARRKFDPYLTVAERQQFLRLLGHIAELIPIARAIRRCRDPRDDKFLELAFSGDADVIVSGDRDLLDLHPFEGVVICSPADYLDRHSPR